jgi:hypothetical protein
MISRALLCIVPCAPKEMTLKYILLNFDVAMFPQVLNVRKVTCHYKRSDQQFNQHTITCRLIKIKKPVVIDNGGKTWES